MKYKKSITILSLVIVLMAIIAASVGIFSSEGLIFIRGRPFGYLLAPVYFILLSILMITLTAKVIDMGVLGQNVIPAIIIIPLFGLISITCSIFIFKNIKEPRYEYT